MALFKTFEVIRTSTGYLTYKQIDQKPCDNAYKKHVGDKDIWAIDIYNVCQLLDLGDETGKEIIITDGDNGLPVLEIYDDYRE